MGHQSVADALGCTRDTAQLVAEQRLLVQDAADLLAAQGLVVIRIGAVITTTVANMDASMAVLPLVVGILGAGVLLY